MNFEIDIIKALIGLIMVLMGWFIKDIIKRVTHLENEFINTSRKLDLVELNNNKNHEHLVGKISELVESMKILINDVKNLNQKIK